MRSRVSDPELPAGESGGPSRRVALVFSLLPVWTILGLSLVGRSFLEPASSNPPGVLGLPLGVVLLGVALSWMAFGVLIVSRARSAGARGSALGLFAIPATALVLLVPSIIGFIADMP